MRKILFFCLSMLYFVSIVAQDVEQQTIEDIVEDSNTEVLAGTLAWPRNIQSRIDHIVQDPLLDVSQMGLLVWDLSADSAIYRYYDKQLMRPASTMKLVTAITAINSLGGDYELKTSLYYSGEIKNRTLYGDLFVVGGMDPLLDEDDLKAFAMALRQLQIDTIRGSIMADKSMKDTLKWGEGWCWDDKNPTLTPLSIGRNVHFLEGFVQTMVNDSIVLDSISIGEGRCPVVASLVTTRKHALDQVLLKMMKDSDNFFAECLLYQTAASTGRRPVSAADAHAVTNRLINSIGLNGSDYRLADGSGLSLYNYVSPELMVRLLRYSWRHPEVYQHLLPSLPIAGQDGTLKKRMRKSSAEGNVRAKTGTLSGIVSLAGYCTAANGHELCFCIINQGVMSWRKGRTLQDRICGALCQP